MTPHSRELADRLTDPNFRGPFQHLRDWSELDRLHDEAAALLRREPSVEEVARVIAPNGWAAWEAEGRPLPASAYHKTRGSLTTAQAVAALWGREPG